MFWTSTEKKSCSIESVSKLAKLDVLLKICFVAGDIEVFFFYFFLSGFFSRTLAIHRTAGEGRGPSFILLSHFHLLTNIQTIICNFAREMTITYF